MPALNLDQISPDTAIFPWAKRTPMDGLRAVLAVGIALTAGLLSGHESAGAIAAGSAFTVGFAIFHEALASSLLSMGLCTLAIASATLAGSLGAPYTWLVLLFTLVAAVNYGLLNGISPTAGWVGQQAATYAIIAAYFPLEPHYAVGRTGMVLAGGALQMIVFTGFFLLRRHPAKAPVATLHLRVGSRIAQIGTRLRAEADFGSGTAAYVLRLSVTLLLSTAIYRRFHIRNGYWAPMTALLVLKPQWTDTLSRGIARLTGTMIAAGITALLAFYLPLPLPMVLALVFVSAWACYAFQAVNYAFFSLFITLYIVFLFRVGGFSQTSAAHIRLANTALGGALALAVDVVWMLIVPTPKSAPETPANPTPSFAQPARHLQAPKANYNRRIVNLDFLGTLQRTHLCGDLRSTNASQTTDTPVTLMGWVNRRRDHGNLIFLDLRDRSGITQVVLDKEVSPLAHAKAEAARPEYVVAVTGRVRERGEGLKNPKMPTGDIELVAQELLLLNDAKTPPFSPAEDAIANEEVRLKYRYIDLRRPELQKNFVLRHNVTRAIRDYLSDNGFLEIETPLLTRSTPEGARDYLVPSRVHPGHFFALPQSPQIFKQLLMVSGFDRYFQIARCFRDEDLRADRQPDFTQIDLEISFPQMSTIFAVAEGFLRAAFAAAGIQLGEQPFIQMTYDQAITRYGIDKPDMRLPAMVDLSAALTPELRETLRIEQTLPVLGFTIPSVGELSGTARKSLLSEIRAFFGDTGLDILDTARLRTNETFLPLAESIEAALAAELTSFSTPYSLLPTPLPLHIVITPKLGTPATWNYDPQWIYKRVGALRLELAKKYADKHGLFTPTNTAADFRFLWVTDFPMYEWNEEHKTWDAAHHPFTSPHEDDILSGRLANDKGAVRALAYDIVLNGTELGSGSIRIHRKDVQQQIFNSLGMSNEEAHARFGFFLDALEYGTPPHGGIALGLDRIVMILAGATSLREVIAFPKTAKAIDLMVDAPTTVSDIQLRDLSLRVVTRS